MRLLQLPSRPEHSKPFDCNISKQPRLVISTLSLRRCKQRHSYNQEFLPGLAF